MHTPPLPRQLRPGGSQEDGNLLAQLKLLE